MPSRTIPLKRAGLLALLPLLCLIGCGTDRVRFIAPPLDRTEQVAAPAIPPATTPCAYDATQLCNTDAEEAGVIAAYDDALAAANRKLAWLRNFFGAVPTKP
jgi:hypothetical protein